MLVSLWHSNVFFLGVSTGRHRIHGHQLCGLRWLVGDGEAHCRSLSAWMLPGSIIMLVVSSPAVTTFSTGPTKASWIKAARNYDAIIAGKSGFLNLPFYLIRMVVYLGIWVVFLGAPAASCR
ncbi:MAG: hypothetical protein WKG07_29420 [Hymenobacter sp.]